VIFIEQKCAAVDTRTFVLYDVDVASPTGDTSHRLIFPGIFEQGVLTMQPQPAIFEEHEIRRVYDEATETWWFSVVDIVQVLTQQTDYQAARNYWKVLKNRLSKEGSESVTKCNRLKLPAADGKNYLTDVATAETLLRLVQSVPSPKAEPIKLWLAKVGYERMQEMADPALSLERARETWQKHGRSDKWIQQRMTGQEKWPRKFGQPVKC
jgi:DNA-damage-inducible protein D